MSHVTLEALRQTEEYQALVKARSSIVWPLAMLMLFVYYAYILVLAFAPDVFATKVGDGHTSLGIVVSMGLILFSFALTGFYVHIANTKLEPLVQKLKLKAEELS